MTRQYIRCCLCGHEFEPPPKGVDLEKCPKCRGRRLMWRFDIPKAPTEHPKGVPVTKEKIL
ncbi:MAG: hypothetical protein JSW58_04980 [Candidatus Latescibacterota bacterium]|nr:MAG: hypothetical protein JSW58_04980 [Candidatus Latescibacterota bacterium]